MARSLSWIDEAELATQLTRAGVRARPGGGSTDVSGPAPSEAPTAPPRSGLAGPAREAPTVPPAAPEREATRAPGTAIGSAGASSPETMAVQPGLERILDDGTGTEPRWPVRTPTAPRPVPVPVDHDDDDDLAMPGPDDETPTPPSFSPPTAEPDSPAGDEPYADVSGPGPYDPTPPPPGMVGGEGHQPWDLGGRAAVPYAVRAAMDALAQARRAASSSAIAAPPPVGAPTPLADDRVGGPGAVDDIPTVSPFGRASSAARTSPFLDRPPTGTALARIQLQARAHLASSAEEATPVGDEFARKSTKVQPGTDDVHGRRPSSPTEELVAMAGPLSERFDALVRLLVEKTGSRGAYVADDDGRPLAAAHCTAPEVALSTALREALRPVRILLEDAIDRSLTLELEGPEYLHVVWVATGAGRFAIGLYTPRVLGGDLAPAVRRMLERIVSETPDPGAAAGPAERRSEPEHEGVAADVVETAGDAAGEGEPAGGAATAPLPTDGPVDDEPAAELEGNGLELPSRPDALAGTADDAGAGGHAGDDPEDLDEDARLDAVLAEDIAPSPTTWAGQLVRRLILETKDPERALRRVALRTGLEIRQLRDPARVPDSARTALEQAVRAVLGEGESDDGE